MPDPTDRLKFHVAELCRRCTRGKAAAKNLSVQFHFILRIVSILLSSMGSVGVIVDKTTSKLSDATGPTFWGSVILLVAGILSQIASEFEITQRAADSRSLAGKCELYDAQLENRLNDNDPRADVAEMLVEVNELIESERYNLILPRMTTSREKAAAARAADLIERNQGQWQLVVRKQKGVAGLPKKSPRGAPSTPATAPEPPKGPSGENSHAT